MEAIKSLAAELIAQAPPKTPNTEPKYNRSNEIKILALTLYSTGYSMQQIADTCNVSKASVHSWIHNCENLLDNDSLFEVSDQLKENLSKKLYINANKSFVSAMDDNKIEKSSTLQLVTAGSIMIDKARLLDGQSTENVAHLYKRSEKAKSKVEALNNEIEELERQLK